MDSRSNMKGKTIKLLNEKIGEHIHDLGVGKVFLNRTPKGLNMKEKVDKLRKDIHNTYKTKDLDPEYMNSYKPTRKWQATQRKVGKKLERFTK